MRWLGFAMVLVWLASGASAAPVSESATPELIELRAAVARQQAQLAEQADQIVRLEEKVEQGWLTQRRVEETKALIRDLLADADTRASLAGDTVTAGHRNGNFFLASDDGDFLLIIKGQLQFRYMASMQPDSADAANDNDDVRSGFEMARTRFGFTGHVVDPSWKFLIWTGYHYHGQELLLDAYLTKELGGGWSVSAGQFKLPFWREWLVSETRQQFVERTLLNMIVSGNYTQGVLVEYKQDAWRVVAALTDGLNGRSAPFDADDTDYALTGRAEWLLTGQWADYADLEGWPEQDMLVVLGGAVHYQAGESGTVAEETDVFQWTADVSVEWSGANLLIAGVGRHADGADDSNLYGLLVQGGVFLSARIELIARYEWGEPGHEGPGLSVATVGVRYFFFGHQLKWTTDVGYSFEPMSPFWANHFTGYRIDAAGRDGQIVARSQFELLF